MCMKTAPDIITGAIGGVIYIAGEVMQVFKSEAKYQQEKIEYEVNKTGAPELNDAQTEAFTKQKEGYKEAKDAALNKAKMQPTAVYPYRHLQTWLQIGALQTPTAKIQKGRR